MSRLIYLLGLVLLPFIVGAQPVVVNKNFSMGTTGRIGAGISPGIDGNTGRQLNLLGQGSIGGRLEQGDYIDLMPAFHFTPVNANKDSTAIQFQARLAFYSSNGSWLGNVHSGSLSRMIIALPEAFVEARNIVGSHWSVWAGARYMRYDDIHINDYFYFDDHSSTGFGVQYKNTAFTMLFPGAMDTSSTNMTPYSFVNIISGAGLVYRQREVLIGEHTLKHGDGHSIKLLAEFHHLAGVSQGEPSYPADNGWLLGAKWNARLNTRKPGSFNQLSIRYGSGIANGGDNGNTQSWNTYGAPDPETKKYNHAYSITAVEHFLLNLSDHFSLNGYALVTHSRGGAANDNKAEDFYHRNIYNSKTDAAIGFRGITYITNWFHLITELHYTQRKDGDQPFASMAKFTLAPTIVPTAERSAWARPHIRLICSVAHYNKFAADNGYSAFLQQAGHKEWGTYLGVRSEWWIF